MKYRHKYGTKIARELVAALAPYLPDGVVDELLNARLGVELTVSAIQRRHSNEQRAYYHMCVDILAREIGLSHDACHEQILIEHFGSEQKQFGDRVIDVPRCRSHALPVSVYSELIETLMRVAAFAGVILPEPERRAA